LHIRVHLWWVSRWIRRLLVVAGARCPLTKPVVAAVELQAATGPHCSRGVQPGGIGASRADSRGSGVGLAPGPQALPIPAAVLIYYLPNVTPSTKDRQHAAALESDLLCTPVYPPLHRFTPVGIRNCPSAKAGIHRLHGDYVPISAPKLLGELGYRWGGKALLTVYVR
jgi:hypothetical protein